MKDIPMFTTEFGVATLILKEVPYRQIAYIIIQSAQQPEDLLKECVSFCRMVGAERIYARGGYECVESYPLHTVVYEMRGSISVDGDKVENLWPVTKETVGQWRQILNEHMRNIDNAGTLEARDEEKILEALFDRIKKAYAEKEALEDPEGLKWLERRIILDAIDQLWQDHLRAMDELRDSIGLRAYAQKDPLVEYKREAFAMFDRLMTDIDQEILNHLFRSATSLQAFEQFTGISADSLMMNQNEFDGGIASIDSGSYDAAPEEPQEMMPEINISFKRDVPKVGPNEPCPCGSGKKFKKCCGK